MWLALSIQRGVLQGVGSYRLVGFSLIGEAALRLVTGGVLIGAGLGATGGFLATGLSITALAIILERPLHRALPPVEGRAPHREALGALARRAIVPLAALALIAWLQNVDVIMVKRMAVTDEAASSYAAVSVAAKMVIWIGVGLGLFLLPEAARRTHAGRDGRPVLTRSLALVAAVGVPMVLFYAVAGQPMLEIVFGPDLDVASDALPWLGLAMSLLAAVYLSAQFLLALGHAGFLALLGAAALIEPVLLVTIGAHLTEIAVALAALQLVLAAACITVGFRRGAWMGATRPQTIQ
jgi:O-antigen/teichoic acid export membrane protein